MKISDSTSVSMPMRNLLSILGATALGVWAYFGVIERLNNIETQGKLMLSDVEKNTGANLGHAIIKNTAVNAIILLVH